MTKRQFLIANLLKKIGFLNKQKRLNNAATELQLLREAEDILGRSIWRNTEHLDLYKINYWNIKKLLKQRAEISDKIQEVKDKIDSIKQNKKSKFEGKLSVGDISLEEMLHKQTIRVKDLEAQQGDISRIASNIRRLYDGTVLKLQTLIENDADTEEIMVEELNIEKLKEKFTALKDSKSSCDEELAKQRAILKKINDSIYSNRVSYKEEATNNYEIMGKANKAISHYRSQLGLLDGKIMEHYDEIGKNISKDFFVDKDCREAAKSKEPLIKLMRALRQSIQYNYQLADR